MSVPKLLVAALAATLLAACAVPVATTATRPGVTPTITTGLGRVVPAWEPTPPGSVVVEPHPALARAGAGPLRVVPHALEVTGARRASRERDRLWVILTPLSSRMLGEVSRDCIGHRLAFLLDGEYLNAPIVHEPLGPSRQLDLLLVGYESGEVRAILERLEPEPARNPLERERIVGETPR